MKKILLFVIAILFLTTTNVWATSMSTDSTTFTRENIKIFPSPSNGLFNVRVDSLGDTFTIVVYDILGKEIYRKQELSSEEKHTVDLRYEPTPKTLKAMYFAIFTNDKGEKVVKKIIVNPQLGE